MAFGSLVPGMPAMPIPQMQPNPLMQSGSAMMNMALQQQRQQQRMSGGGMPGAGMPGGLGRFPPGLLQRLLGQASPPGTMPSPGGVMPAAPPGSPVMPAAPPMDLSPTGMPPQPGGPPNPMQMGLLGKMFGMMRPGGQPPVAPMMPTPPPGVMPAAGPNLGGLY